MLKDLVHNWLLGGADPEVGLRLFMDHCNPSFITARIISREPSKHLQTVRTALLKASGLSFDFRLSAVPESKTPQSASDIPNRPKLRNQWPFLAEPTCPPELKLLVSDKITAYTECVKEYGNLTTAVSPEEQLKSVKNLVESFISNHEIFKELKHYSETGKVLGKHQIFQQYQRIKDLRNLNTLALFDRKKNLEHAIWRNESKIKKEKRPDLLTSRKNKIKELKMQLAEVIRLLE